MNWRGLLKNSAIVVVTAACTWAVDNHLISFQASTSKRIENATMAYSDYSETLVRLLGIQSTFYFAELSRETFSKRLKDPEEQRPKSELKGELNAIEQKLLTLSADLVNARRDYYTAAARVAIYGDSETLSFVKLVSEEVNHGIVNINKKNITDVLVSMRDYVGAENAKWCDVWASIFPRSQHNSEYSC